MNISSLLSETDKKRYDDLVAELPAGKATLDVLLRSVWFLAIDSAEQRAEIRYTPVPKREPCIHPGVFANPEQESEFCWTCYTHVSRTEL